MFRAVERINMRPAESWAHTLKQLQMHQNGILQRFIIIVEFGIECRMKVY
jgi:hypothetical protein